MEQELLEKLFQQASVHHSTKNISNSDEKSYMYLGIKISKQNNNYLLQLANNNYYTDPDLTNVFKQGWVVGVNKYKKIQYKRELNKIEKQIAYEMNNKKDFNEIKKLREKREHLLKKYNNTRKTLKQNNYE